MKRLDVIEHLVRNAEMGIYRGEKRQGIFLKRLRLTLDGEYDKAGNMAQVLSIGVDPQPAREATDQPFYHPAVLPPEDRTEPDSMETLGLRERDFR